MAGQGIVMERRDWSSFSGARVHEVRKLAR